MSVIVYIVLLSIIFIQVFSFYAPAREVVLPALLLLLSGAISSWPWAKCWYLSPVGALSVYERVAVAGGRVTLADPLHSVCLTHCGTPLSPLAVLVISVCALLCACCLCVVCTIGYVYYNLLSLIYIKTSVFIVSFLLFSLYIFFFKFDEKVICVYCILWFINFVGNRGW